ncbi:hypothetical protein GCM10007425_27830 [Lysinibacillus alkalisoli]|uniref:DUF2292 domain-containing protein n=1 Tax=Lysinibacillus alkalisoli TaxID=1911548 RepID=A0A917LJ15_9BACI|nr:YezD family protein [Lysinibacillus alkalisoli]GGG31625.1 hypothetical protein GCM10007425_27830 [Lysinibacillus alkalisoli]
MTVQQQPKTVFAEIEKALAQLQFGTVHITVHEGRVVQIERTEKIRITQ